MDVHVPHQPLHTWKDFWIHLGTITIGLLIAIGLEQSVEKLHHLHQRHQLEEDLQAEAEKNLKIMDDDYTYFDANMTWLSAYRDDVDTMRASGGKIKLPYRRFYPPQGLFVTIPSSSAWTAASESELTALLPREEVKMYDRVYFELKSYDDSYERKVEDTSKELIFEARFAHVTLGPYGPDLSHMSKGDLDQLSAILGENMVVSRQVRNRLDILYEAEKSVAVGSTTEDEVLAAIEKRMLANRPKPPAAPAQ